MKITQPYILYKIGEKKVSYLKKPTISNITVEGGDFIIEKFCESKIQATIFKKK